MFVFGPLYFFAILFAGVAVYIVASQFFSEEEKFKASEKLEDNVSQVKIKRAGIILLYSRPFFKRFFSPVVGGMKSRKKIRERYRQSLATAGLSDILTTDDFYAFKLFLIIGFPILFLLIRQLGGFIDWPVQLAPFLGILGFFYPDIWIRGKIDARQKNIILNLPFSVDMLALSVEAGLDFVAAMSKVVDKAVPSELSDEFQTIIKEIRVGSSRAEALRNFAWRTQVLEVSSLVATLIAADSVGASIGPILKTLSEDVRRKRSSMIEQKGAQAATKMLIPMICLILPAVLIVILSPVMLSAMLGGR